LKAAYLLSSKRTDIERIIIDEEIVKTSSLTLIAGRDLDLDKFPTDSTAVLVNESTVRLMGFDNPLGETIGDNGRENASLRYSTLCNWFPLPRLHLQYYAV
jgi:hypothetical protein